MANAANSKKLPDLTAISLEDRSLWLLARLRELPGKVLENEAGSWLQLELTGSIIAVLEGFAPTLTGEQLRSSSRLLGEKKLRVSANKGGGKFTHLIKLEDGGDDASEVSTPDDGKNSVLTTPDAGSDPARAAAVLDRAAAEITRLRGEVNRLTEENAALRRQLALDAPFHDGVEKLREALGN